MITKKLFVIFFAVVGLSACVPNKKAPVNAPNDAATIKLAEAANSVSKSLIELAKIEESAKPPMRKDLVLPESLELSNRASIDWVGPIGPLVERIAKSTHHRLRVLGNPPAIPVLVNVSVRDAKLADILRDLDYQAGFKADIRVNSQMKVIELRYAKA